MVFTLLVLFELLFGVLFIKGATPSRARLPDSRPLIHLISKHPEPTRVVTAPGSTGNCGRHRGCEGRGTRRRESHAGSASPDCIHGRSPVRREPFAGSRFGIWKAPRRRRCCRPNRRHRPSLCGGERCSTDYSV